MNFKLALTFLIGLFILTSCTTKTKDETTLILISKEYDNNITKWIQNVDENIATKVCYGLNQDSLDLLLTKADAIIIGGGEDVNPIHYNKPEYTEVCGDFDNYRDSLEITMITFAHKNKIPILGICRGQQAMNVVHGGTLIPDIPTFVESSISHRSELDSAHYIHPTQASWIKERFTQDSFPVNSRHHQSIDRPAKNFEVAAYASDSIIEAIFIKDTSIHPFTMAVQFHPENLRDPLSTEIANMLLEAIQ